MFKKPAFLCQPVFGNKPKKLFDKFIGVKIKILQNMWKTEKGDFDVFLAFEVCSMQKLVKITTSLYSYLMSMTLYISDFKSLLSV